ncbi:MAG: ribonuclease E/G [Alphaproteobacteria bacterium]|nr:ribonuclease E/G [Alphaproteobacteria bacterium]
MIDEILINAGPRRRRIALVRRERLVAYYQTQRQSRHPERIILGRVKSVQGDLDAAFVDIGEGREALLHARDTAAKRGTAIARAVYEGQDVLVQLKREAEHDKGARVSARPALGGPALVFLPLGANIELSSHIKDPVRRRQLLALGQVLQDRHGGGLIMRSGAAAMTDDGLERETDGLWRRWRAVEDRAKAARPPELLDAGVDPLALILREHSGPELRRIRVDDRALAAELQPAPDDGLPAIELHDGPESLFAAFDLEAQIDAALASHVALPSGGRIIIEHTQALTAIDVDSGQSGPAGGTGDPARLARETNHQAAREIAAQLRLREMGGRVVIDFIPMRGKGEVTALLNEFQGWLDDDPARPRLGRMSELGLVELTRRRRQPALALRLGEVCPLCGGGGLRPSARHVADNLLERILRETAAAKGRPLVVRAAPEVVADLGGAEGEILTTLAREQGCRVQLSADPALALEAFEVTTVR